MAAFSIPPEFQAHIARMTGYVPGEQPRDGGYTRLNTNENAYPPSPRVIEAISRALGDSLRLYPDPLATELRQAAAEMHGVDPACILAGNGSDDLLTILTRAFVGPGDALISPTPSYVLYRTLAELQNARYAEIPFEPDWSLDIDAFARHAESVNARLAFLANPNSPSGTMLGAEHVAALAQRLSCVLVVDEAYADFANGHCVGLVGRLPNVVVLRTLSKGYGLAGLRVGYLVASPRIVEGLIKVKDSYNCDRLSIVGAAAALRDQAYLAETVAKVRNTRARMIDRLARAGYTVAESQANFAWCQGGPPAPRVYEALRARRILVRLMRYPGLEPGLRITVGTDEEVDRMLAALDEILAGSARR